MKSIVISIVIFLTAFSVYAQDDNIYIVSSATLNIRSGPGTTYEIRATLSKNDEVTLIDKGSDGWWYIDFNGTKGYASSQFLKMPGVNNSTVKKDPYKDWEKKDYESGATPDCDNIIPQFNYEIDNYLKISVGSNTDVAVKLMKMGYDEDVCIRMVYIRSNETFYLKNVPEGRYYLKIAYGKDWRQSIVNNQCIGKFIKNVQYEKGEEVLDFNLQKTYNGVNVPYFELSLNVITTQYKKDSYNADNISEKEFNK
jgi:uncharacterized protein YgiM (DUF1202 family)